MLINVQEQIELVIKCGMVVGSSRKQCFQYVDGIKCIIGNGESEKKKQEKRREQRYRLRELVKMALRH